MADNECEHGTCTCRSDGADACVREGHAFCSPGCAANEGCTHADCDCAEHTA